MDPKNRTFKAKTPLRLILGIVLGSIVLLAAIFYAVWYSGVQITDAKKSGIIVSKHFEPQAEEQIILGKGTVSTRQKAGEYTLMVEVKGRDGVVKSYAVSVGQELYDSLKVGDPYDVGPVLVPE